MTYSFKTGKKIIILSKSKTGNVCQIQRFEPYSHSLKIRVSAEC